MKLLLDQGLPRSTAQLLRGQGIQTQHVGELGMAQSTDEAIIEYARNNGFAIVTLDADFHAQLAMARASGPSATRIRMQRLKAHDAAGVIAAVLGHIGNQLESGIIVTVTTSNIRLRRLPTARRN